MSLRTLLAVVTCSLVMVLIKWGFVIQVDPPEVVSLIIDVW